MPVAGKEYTKKIILTNYAPDEAYVVLLMNPKAALFTDIDTTNPKESRFDMYARLIKEWNFTDEKTGEVLDITAKTVKETLSTFDFIAIDAAVNIKPGLSEEKKTTVSTPPDNQ